MQAKGVLCICLVPRISKAFAKVQRLLTQRKKPCMQIWRSSFPQLPRSKYVYLLGQIVGTLGHNPKAADIQRFQPNLAPCSLVSSFTETNAFYFSAILLSNIQVSTHTSELTNLKLIDACSLYTLNQYTRHCNLNMYPSQK
jgi:hypothetical protein